MSERFLLRLRPEDPAAAEWLVFDPQGRAAGAPGHGGLAQAAQATGARPVTVLAPAEDVVLTGAAVPARRAQQRARALPFALEDQLTGDVEDLHFALGPPGPAHYVPAAVVARGRLEAWLEALRAAGLDPTAVIPDVLALPRDADAWTLLLEPDRALLRTGPCSGLTVEPDQVAAYLTILRQEAEAAGSAPPGRLAVYRTPGAPPAPPDSGMALEEIACHHPLTVLAQGLEPRASIDLLQGPYARNAGASSVDWRAWRVPAAVLGALIIVHLAGDGLERHRLGRAAEQLEQRVETLYRETFPDARKVVDPRVQMQRRLDVLRREAGEGGARLLPLLAAAGEALAAAPGARLQGLDYRDRRLSMQLTAGSLQDLDRLKQRLAERTGLAVEIEQAAAEGERVEGRLRIEPPT